MKSKFLILVMMLIYFTVSAQDVIVKQDGSTILARVLKVTQTEVEYKKASNSDGPTYSLPITEVLSINYENGEKDAFNLDPSTTTTAAETRTPINGETPQSTLSTPSYTQTLDMRALSAYQEKEELLRSARVNQTWGTVCLVVGIGGAVTSLVLLDSDNPLAWVTTGAGVLLATAGGGILYGTASRQRREANSIRVASLYEKEFQIGSGLSVSPGLKLMAGDRTNGLANYSLGLGAKFTF